MPGRILNIVSTVRDLFNDASAGFISDGFIVGCINRCLADLAQEGYWVSQTWLPCVESEPKINIIELVPNFQSICQMYFQGSQTPMTALAGFQEYSESALGAGASGTPEAYSVLGDSIYVWPSPSITLEQGYYLHYSYNPAQMDDPPSDRDPPIPQAHDIVFVYFALRLAYLRDRHAPGGDTKFIEYSRLYAEEKQKILAARHSQNMALRPYR
jgi:hypothetical protein